eukprot:1159895-Rhodomonas_salina.1
MAGSKAMYVVVLSNQFLSCCKLKHLGRRTLSFKSRYRVATQEHAGQSVQQTFGPARGAELV